MSYFSEQGEIEEVFNLLCMFSLTFTKLKHFPPSLHFFCFQASQSFNGTTTWIDATIRV